MNCKNIKYIIPAILLVCSLFTIVGCDNSSSTPDVSDIDVKLNTRRLDKDLYSVDTNNIAQGLVALKQKYPDFLDFYLDTLMGFGVNGNYTNDNAAIEKGLKTFLTHKDYRGVFDSVLAKYPDTKETEEQLEKGFKYMKHYFPSFKVPEIIYVTSGLNNYGAFTYGEDVLAIGLDMFLGKDYPFYKAVGIPDYFYRQLETKYIPVASFRTIHREKHPFIIEGKILLDMMIQSGKEMYFITKVLPFLDEKVVFAYTDEQIKWCRKNEAMVYDFFVRQELLYENNVQKVVRYVMDGPSATGMPAESPGNVGSWLGLQIVKAYAEKHSDMSLKDLLDQPINAQRFLQESKYKPK